MKHPPPFLLIFCLLASAVQAAERFELNSRPRIIPERGEVPGLALLTERNTFLLLPPPDWRASTDAAEKKVTFLSADRSMSMVIQFAKRNPALVPQIQAEWLRQQLRERYANAQFLEEFECYAGDLKGRAFDLQHDITGKKVCTRVCFAALPEGGSVEFTLTAGLEKFPGQHVPFSSLLSSLRIEPAPSQ